MSRIGTYRCEYCHHEELLQVPYPVGTMERDCERCGEEQTFELQGDFKSEDEINVW